MLRNLHSLPGLFFALLLSVTTATGAILAFEAFLEDHSAPWQGKEVVLSELSARVVERFPDVEKIAQTPSGKLRVTYTEDGTLRAVFIDPVTAAPLGEDTPSKAMRTITNLHRAWLIGDAGRATTGLSALAMLLLSGTGLVLLKRRVGGWTRLLAPLGGSGMRRWHLELGRIAIAGLMLSSITGVTLSLAGFDIIPDGSAQHDVLVSGSGGERAALHTLDGLKDLTLQGLRDITLPYAGDATDPIVVRTDRFVRNVDAATGAILREEAHSLAWQAHDLMFRLHTARGMAWLALLLGLSSLTGTVLSITGALVWLRKRRAQDTVRHNASAAAADILLLVGSDGGTTWGFARTLHQALIAGGRRVHLSAMNDLPAQAPLARHMILLAATAGTGEAPASAVRFLDRLASWTPPAGIKAMVLGFGDRQFDSFCGYARTVESALGAKGLGLAMPTSAIDRQSGTEFSAWGAQLADALSLPLALDHKPAPLRGHRYTLLSRQDFGHEVQAPTAVLRFRIDGVWPGIARPMQRLIGRIPRFSAGDLMAICPPGDARTRLYSIASSDRSDILEICVRKQPGGACSGYLHTLVPGATLEAAIRPNPAFRPDASRAPLILIGAGAGIAPLVGFVRDMGHRRPVHLYWGGRSPGSDFLYRQELEIHALDGRLAGWRTVFSRVPGGGYVQHLITEDAQRLRLMVQSGAQILICGGREMAAGVGTALDVALAPLGLNVAGLRAEGRLIEDVY